MQAHSGVFHLLPLGLRVQNKLEILIDRHMSSISANKLSLSSISTEELWKESGRYSANSELLRLKDRRDSGFLLSPTHEEEITSLVAGLVHSYKDLPLRLYQIGRKYRDERRPRGGLLRTKEFLMKDLYTFDYDHEQALATYEATRAAYTNLFDELKIPYLVADADSGNMGGKLSHEYHFVSPKGEDNVWSCNSCKYVANEELVEKRAEADTSAGQTAISFTGISQDRTTKIEIHVPRPQTSNKDDTPGWDKVQDFINLHAVKSMGIDLDTGIEAQTLNELLAKTNETTTIYDISLPQASSQSKALDLTIIRPGDACPKCEHGKLDVQTAIEVGHTFHLGARYSIPMNALVAVPNKAEKVPMQMGCHGIGVSRLIGAVASMLSDQRGLNWPRVIAPFEVVVVATPEIPKEDVDRVYKHLEQLAHSDDSGSSGIDMLLDDRPIKSLAWKLRDADLIGYPVIVVLGRGWKANQQVEVQCRRLGFKTEMGIDALGGQVIDLLKQL